MRCQGAANSGLFARIERAKMPKRPTDKPKVAIKREQRLLAGSVECSNFTEGKSRFKNRLAIILKQILSLIGFYFRFSREVAPKSHLPF